MATMPPDAVFGDDDVMPGVYDESKTWKSVSHHNKGKFANTVADRAPSNKAETMAIIKEIAKQTQLFYIPDNKTQKQSQAAFEFVKEYVNEDGATGACRELARKLNAEPSGKTPMRLDSSAAPELTQEQVDELVAEVDGIQEEISGILEASKEMKKRLEVKIAKMRKEFKEGTDKAMAAVDEFMAKKTCVSASGICLRSSLTHPTPQRA